MQTHPGIHLKDVQAVYAGPEGRLWELLMGEQIHIGGLSASQALADRAGIAAGSRGLDLCCASGAGMRFLLRFRKVAHMTGVDATPQMLRLARERTERESFVAQTSFVEADVCRTGLPSCHFDFVWGEDAWCYVEDKSGLIREAARLIKPGGTIAFTDWMEGAVAPTCSEATRLLTFMKFPSLLKLEDYCALLEASGFRIACAQDTSRFPQYAALYLQMIESQLTYDALKIIGFDQELAARLVVEMRALHELAQAGKIIQALIVAQKQS